MTPCPADHARVRARRRRCACSEELQPVAVKKAAGGTWSSTSARTRPASRACRSGHGAGGDGGADRPPARAPSSNGTVSPARPAADGDLQHLHERGRPGRGDVAPTVDVPRLPYVQVTGLPDDYTPTRTRSPRCRRSGNVPAEHARSRPQRADEHVQRMSRYSIMLEHAVGFTDCPHREKLAGSRTCCSRWARSTVKFDVAAHLRADGPPHGRVPAARRAGAGHRPGDDRVRRRLPRRSQLGRGDHPHAVLAVRDIRRPRDDARVLSADAQLHGLPAGPGGERDRPRRPRRLGRGRHVDARRGHRHLRLLQLGEGDGPDGRGTGPHRRRGDLHGARRQHRGRVQRALLQPATRSYTTAAGRHHRLAGDGRDAAGMGIVGAETEQPCSTTSSRASAPTTPTAAARTSAAARCRCRRSSGPVAHGRGEFLWEVCKEPTPPSYGNFVQQGRTTIPESGTWRPRRTT